MLKLCQPIKLNLFALEGNWFLSRITDYGACLLLKLGRMIFELPVTAKDIQECAILYLLLLCKLSKKLQQAYKESKSNKIINMMDNYFLTV